MRPLPCCAGKRLSRHTLSRLWDVHREIDSLTDHLSEQIQYGDTAVLVPRDQATLREKWPAMKKHGKAQGGFLGAYRIAAVMAVEVAEEDRIDANLVFADEFTESAVWRF